MSFRLLVELIMIIKDNLKFNQNLLLIPINNLLKQNPPLAGGLLAIKFVFSGFLLSVEKPSQNKTAKENAA